MPQNKNPIQQRIEQERALSPANELTPQQIAQRVGNLARAEGVRAVRDQISASIKNSDAYKQGIANRDQTFRQDPEYQRAHKQRMQDLRKNPEFIERQKKGIQALRNDPTRSAELNRKSQEGVQRAKQTAEYWENYYKAIEKRDSDPEYHKRRIAASNAKIAIKISTPDGLFDSISDAARHYGLTSEGMRHRVNSDKYPDYKKIQK